MINNKIRFLIAGGLLVRSLFFLFGGVIYYGTKDFTVNGDTFAWIDSIMNLIRHGHYTADPEVPNASFYRPPGLAFFIGLFYILSGNSLETALAIIPWVQIVMDTCCIWFIYKVSLRIFQDDITALLAAALYAFYPFIIVWTPVITAESISVFFMLSSLYCFYGMKKRNPVLSGILLGIAVLTRLQVMFLFPFLAASLFIYERKHPGFRKYFAGFILAFSLTYGMWPARNLFFHDRLLFGQDLNVGRNWSPDYLAFMDYVFAIQTDHKPQYDQIINSEEVWWPEHAYLHEGDSVLLAQTVDMCRKCGTGFSYFMKHHGKKTDIVRADENCDEEIAANFKKLTAAQKEDNKFSYYVKIPLGNLYKSLFKLHLYGEKSTLVKTFSLLLFLYRTILVFTGIAGLVMMARRRLQRGFIFSVTGFFVLWYLYLSFIYRNIEIRYLLPVDILLLIPASYVIRAIIKRKANPV